VYGILAGVVLIIFALGSKSIFSDTKDKIQPQSVNKTQPRSVDKIQPQNIVLIPSTRTQKQKASDDGLWDGPVLFHKAGSQPIHLILVEKATQNFICIAMTETISISRRIHAPPVNSRAQNRKRKTKRPPKVSISM